MNWILLMPDELDANGVVSLSDRRAAHIQTVLGSGIGDLVRVGLLGGSRGRARVIASADNAVTLDCQFDQPSLAPSGISLLLALPRPKVMRRLWLPLASMGVEKVVLTNAGKVERSYFDTHWLDPDVYRPHLIEGLEQSGGTRLPEVRICRRLKPFVEDESKDYFGSARRFLFHPYQSSPLAAQRIPVASSVVIAIGPEGGWSDFEVTLLSRYDFQRVSFGQRTLRTDTAVQAILGAVTLLRMQGSLY